MLALKNKLNMLHILSVWVTSCYKTKMGKSSINRAAVHSSVHHDFFNKINGIGCVCLIEEQDGVNVSSTVFTGQFFCFLNFSFDVLVGSTTMDLIYLNQYILI